MADVAGQVVPRRLIFLGSGTSTGVPVLGCDCSVCTSTDPRNNRTRPSVLLQLPAGNVLIDTTPEMRIQLLRERVGKVHTILYTHYHADHLFGLDDARLFPKSTGGPVPVYCEETTEHAIRRVFDYAFDAHAMSLPTNRVTVPRLEFRSIRPGEPFDVLGQPVLPVRLLHGRFEVLGFRFGNLAYCTDVVKIPEETYEQLQGVDTLILDALRHTPHPTHFSLEQALEAVARIGPRRAFFTHLSHDLDHEATEKILPSGVALAYDGLSLDF